MIRNNYYVLTGGPGAGKSTLLKEIEKHGLHCSHEVAREIIQEQVASGGRALPWDDTKAYSEIMFTRSKEAYEDSSLFKGPVIFDRGIPDVIGYMKLIGLSVPKEFYEVAKNYRYNQTVFILPHWEEIYINDAERKQSHQEARETFEVLRQTYEELQYRVVEVPKDTIEKRFVFLRQKIG
ncbi:AAA family ATPase [Peredibacter sp. HCB2-198]|uniref:AAA family ATPase n=1 Tax=Peredibacter sp. HCB2-198 TaxID=3383025 RepID=UPI0038B5148D